MLPSLVKLHTPGASVATLRKESKPREHIVAPASGRGWRGRGRMVENVMVVGGELRVVVSTPFIRPPDQRLQTQGVQSSLRESSATGVRSGSTTFLLPCFSATMSSALDDVLHTNYVPTDAQVAAIRADIGPRLIQVDALDEQIRALTAQRDELVAYIDPRLALVSPCRRVPAEILQKIFMDCLPEDSAAAYEPASAPLLLGRVCSQWRDVAHGTPELWASLHVPFSFFAREVDRTEALDAWLSRSGTRPLSLSIVGTDGQMLRPTWDYNAPRVDPYQPAIVACALSILLRHAPRWKHLQLSKLKIDMAQEIFAQRAPGLESLEFMEAIPLHLEEMPLLGSTRLKRLMLSRPHRGLLSALFPIRWGNITELTVGGTSGSEDATSTLSLQEAIGLLSVCHELRHFLFVMNQVRWIVDPDNATLAVLLPALKLQSLTISTRGYDRDVFFPSAVFFWRSISSMPSLEKLVLPEKVVPTDTTFLEIIAMSPNLRTLSAPPLRNSANVPAILNALPRIAALRFTTDRYTPDAAMAGEVSTTVLQLLTPPSTLCHHLSFLDLSRSFPIANTTIRAFLHAHVSSLTPFRDLRIHFMEGQEDPVLSEEDVMVFRAARIRCLFSIRPKKDVLRPAPAPAFGTRAAEGRARYNDPSEGMLDFY
ncbi:hypothetical protein MKEN_00204900 [Mycena kentingensis (nom. inval.)]|nr:hypothetical protein MKEN_00204900 [Mycena kentingensis (nom. inval.)]